MCFVPEGRREKRSEGVGKGAPRGVVGVILVPSRGIVEPCDDLVASCRCGEVLRTSGAFPGMR